MPKRLPSRRWEQTSLVNLPALEEEGEDDDEGLYSSELGGVRRKAEPTAIAAKAMTLSIRIRSAFTRDEIFGWSKRWPITRPHGAIHSRMAVSQGS
jgi:hypothetical protein